MPAPRRRPEHPRTHRTGHVSRQVHLTILCWDRPCCVNPTTAAAAVWERSHENIGFTVRARPLAVFDNQPIVEIARSADLLFIDHPMVGRVADEDALVPMESLVGDAALAALAADSTGGSHHSYHWAGSQWATAVNAACHVAVVDDGRLGDLAEPPRRLSDVLVAARRTPGSVAMPLYPSDAVLALLSISADLRGRCCRRRTVAQAGRRADGRARPGGGPALIQAEPAGLLDLMSSTADGDVPAYAPLLFGYSNYQRPGAPGRLLRFCPPTGFGHTPATVLGGSGPGRPRVLPAPQGGRRVHRVAGRCRRAAHGAAAQRRPAGQPAGLVRPQGRSAGRRLLLRHRTTIEPAYLRPRTPWWPAHQHPPGVLRAAALRRGEPADVIHSSLTVLSDQARNEEYAR